MVPLTGFPPVLRPSESRVICTSLQGRKTWQNLEFPSLRVAVDIVFIGDPVPFAGMPVVPVRTNQKLGFRFLEDNVPFLGNSGSKQSHLI